MTADETREQKALLLLEYQETEAELANVEEKARRLAERILAVGYWLLGFASDRSADIAMSEAWVPGPATRINVKEAKTVESMNYQTATAVIQQMWQVRGRLAELRKRKDALGLK